MHSTLLPTIMRAPSFHLPVLLCTLSLLLCGASTVCAQDAAALQQMYMRFLEAKGYDPSIDKDGDVQFKIGKRTYFVDVHKDDPEFFMIALPNIWPIESEQERRQVLAAADRVNREDKAVKVTTKDDDVWVTCEVFLPSAQDFNLVFNRMLKAIDGGVDAYVKHMKE